MSSKGEIPWEEALRICERIRKENEGKVFSLSRWHCWGCITFTKGDPGKMCFSGSEGNRGCSLINRAYDDK